jgi:hypothetical protein
LLRPSTCLLLVSPQLALLFLSWLRGMGAIER